MKKTSLIFLSLFTMMICIFLTGIDKDSVLVEEPLLYEKKLPVQESSYKEEVQASAVIRMEEKAEETGEEETILPEEVKLELLKEQQNCYAYSMLQVTEQNIYTEILYALENRIEEMELSTRDIEEIDKIFQCVLIDHPEIFYADGYSFVKYTYGQEVRRVTFTGKYLYEEEETEKKKLMIQQSADRILKKIPDNLSDYEKVKKVYEEIIYNTEYSLNAKDNQNICSVFLEGASVCQGYAKAVQFLLNQLSIPTTLVVGTVENGEGHAWNMVKIDNQYYYVDATWGDASYAIEKQEEMVSSQLPLINYDYLCITTEELCRTHSIDHVVPLPECTAKAANYYRMENAYFEDFNEEQLLHLINNYIAQGRESVTIKCATEEVYQEMIYHLLEEQEIFSYLDTGENSIVYADSQEQLSLTFWLIS